MIGGYLMSNLSRNVVHLRWLLKLVDFRIAGEFSWGSAVLATLYLEMCRATPPNKAKIEGCLLLLQSWSRYVGIPTAFEDKRLILDQRSEAQVPLVNYATIEMHQMDRVLRLYTYSQINHRSRVSMHAGLHVMV
ncbi:hypothetical protein Godav_009977 [Gossypium davidsonii]|uniref:Aminotransferase-like plant mobile domain-containing protein n=1 Tax=Gossypium davidsonii TaxID=34287 RepID=A0A7J8SFK1_GOSDV|nr:hypothetical protein [Gossypium davidsonii]